MKLSQIPTPALVVQAKTLQKNAESMQKLLENSSLALRPHYKSHKCASIARWQVENCAKGMTCAKLSEAEDLADAGIEDILIANQIVQPEKLLRLASLAQKCRLTVCVDNRENIDALDAAAGLANAVIHCLVEYDIGMERCGVTEPQEVAALAKYISAAKNLRFEGVQAYAGHLSHEENKAARQAQTAENARKLRALLTTLEENGVKANTLSGGSTGTAQLKAAEGLYTELQAGSYLFMDATYRHLNLPFENSLFLLTTVVSTRPGLTVVDAGVKTCGVDQGDPVPVEGTVQKIVASEEHFQLHGYSLDKQVGDKLLLTPGHCCSTVNLHDKIYVVDGDRVIARIPVTARGCGK